MDSETLDRLKFRLRATDLGLGLRPVDPHLRLLRRVFGCMDGAVAVDVGASDGFYSRALADAFDVVVSVEPNPGLTARLERRLPKRCLLIAAAAGAEFGRAALRVPVYSHEPGHYRATLSQDNQFAGTPVAAVETVEVPVAPLDAMIGCSHRRVGVVKIDTEGFELEVLAGARELLERHQPVLAIEVDRRQNPRFIEVYDALSAGDRKVALVDRDRLVALDRERFLRLQSVVADAAPTLGYEPVNYLSYAARDAARVGAFLRPPTGALDALWGAPSAAAAPGLAPAEAPP